MVTSVLDSGSSAGQGHCVVFLGKTLYSHSASPHPGVQMSTSELLGQPSKLLGSNLQLTSTPSRGSGNTPGCLMQQKAGISSGGVGHFGLSVDITTWGDYT